VSSNAAWSWEHIPCIMVFSALYYTMMSAFLWWLTLTVSWFLSSALKWSSEAVGRLAPLYHVVSWILPLVMTVGLLIGQVMSGDELTGTCFVVRDSGYPSFYALLIGVILPLTLFMFVGIIFLIIGLVSVCRTRAFLRNKGKQQESVVLEKLMLRVGVFVSVYIVPATAVIICFTYELIARPNWVTVSERERCDANQNCSGANPIVILVRIFMFLLIGSLTGVWIWSKKTVESWRSLGDRCHSCYSNPPTTPPSSSQQTSGDSESTMNS
jgi:hypothetical protein